MVCVCVCGVRVCGKSVGVCAYVSVVFVCGVVCAFICVCFVRGCVCLGFVCFV